MRSRAFTLIELLVVITVIAILMGFLIPALGRILCRANAGKTQALIEQIETALAGYHARNDGVYPPTDSTSPPGSANLAAALTQGYGYVDPTTSTVGGVPPQFINQVWGVNAGTINGVIHYRNNQAAAGSFAPPPATSHPVSAVRPGTFDLWATGCELNEVSALNNWQ